MIITMGFGEGIFRFITYGLGFEKVLREVIRLLSWITIFDSNVD